MAGGMELVLQKESGTEKFTLEKDDAWFVFEEKITEWLALNPQEGSLREGI